MWLRMRQEDPTVNRRENSNRQVLLSEKVSTKLLRLNE